MFGANAATSSLRETLVEMSHIIKHGHISIWLDLSPRHHQDADPDIACDVRDMDRKLGTPTFLVRAAKGIGFAGKVSIEAARPDERRLPGQAAEGNF